MGWAGSGRGAPGEESACADELRLNEQCFQEPRLVCFEQCLYSEVHVEGDEAER